LTVGGCVCAHSSEFHPDRDFAPILQASWSEMDVDHLQDRLYWGLNRTASILGRVTDAYRPHGAADPLDRSNRYLQLPAAFSRSDGNFAQPTGYGVAVWRGHFDASYTRTGDYLVQEHDIWFIAAQQSLLPILCVKTNRLISITRQQTPTTGAYNDAGNVNSAINVISRWPASLLGISTEGRSPTQLPGDTKIPTVTALLPSIHDQVVRPADIVTDEDGNTGIVVAAELSDLGWRLNVRSVTT
jgi:hypothetical protein